MSYELVSWAQRLPDLTPAQKLIFCAICDRVDPKQGGYFWIRLSDFVADDLGNQMSVSRLRAHIANLAKKGYMKTVHRGGGPQGRNTRRSRTHYRILYPEHIAPQVAEQFRLPLLTLIKRWDAMVPNNRRPAASEFEPSEFEQPSKSSPSESEPKLARLPSESEPKLARLPSESEPKLARLPSESEPKLARLPSESDTVTLYKNRRHVTEGPTVSQTASTASDHSDLETLCAVASEIDISGLLPEDIGAIKPALHEYRGLQRRRPLEEVARRIANQVKRNIPDSIRSDHLRIVRYFTKVASELLRRGGGVSVAGTRRDPGKLHPETIAASENEDWRERYERNRAWHDERIKAQGG